MEEASQNPANRENAGKAQIQRNPDGTFPKGVSGNPNGRPKGTLKDYLRRKFCEMTEEEKEEFIKGIEPFDLFRMAEGNPHTTTDVTSKGERIEIPILNNVTLQRDDGHQESDGPEIENPGGTGGNVGE